MLQLTNNAKSTLAFGITAGDTTVEIVGADASLFPALTLPEDYFMAALANNPIAGGELKLEFVMVTGATGAVFTIERAQEGTTAQAFDAGDRFELRMTADAFADMRGNVWKRPTSGGTVQTPTFVDATSFTIPGDFTGEFVEHRAVKAYQTSDDSGFVVSSSYDGSTETTVTVTSMTLDSGLALVELGLDTGSAPRYGHAATADNATTADDADTIDGMEATDFALAAHNHAGVYEPVISKETGFNLPLGDQAAAEAGTADDLLMTPELVAFAIAALAGGGSPAGTVAHYSGDTAPEGWLVRDGSEISRTTYADLFAVIGETFGAGDGSTTFRLPDDRNLFDRGVPSGGTVGTYQADEFKSHTHYISQPGNSQYEGPSWFNSTDYLVSVQTTATGGDETRPKNRHYLPIIKY
jgi:hypothetical protein